MGEVSDSRDGETTRRRFIQTVSTAAAAAVLGPALPALEGGGRSRVVLVRDEEALDAAGSPRSEVVQRMLDRGICELTGANQPVDGWRKVLGASSPVGVKTNVWKNLPTPPEVEAAIRKRIAETGIPEDRIRIDDRGARTSLAGCPALVNVRPLRTHHWAGIGGCLKNPIMFVEDPSVYHPDLCADMGAFWKLPILRGKVKLNILVALTPQFLTRAPHHFDSRYVWPYRGMFLSTDPVAVDAIGVTLLEAKRKLELREERPLSQLAHHVRIAGEKHGLGVWERSRIDLVKIGWERDALI